MLDKVRMVSVIFFLKFYLSGAYFCKDVAEGAVFFDVEPLPRFSVDPPSTFTFLSDKHMWSNIGRPFCYTAKVPLALYTNQSEPETSYTSQNVLFGITTKYEWVSYMSKFWNLWMTSAKPVRCVVTLPHAPAVYPLKAQERIAQNGLNCTTVVSRYAEYQMSFFASVRDLVDIADEEIKWFAIGDDDTFWVVENLLRLLRLFNHSMPLYIGDISENMAQANAFNGIVGAFGGGGIILSRPLAERFAGHYDTCLKLYQRLSDGDSMIAHCLHSLNASFTRARGFHQMDLFGDVTGLFQGGVVDRDMITMHHFVTWFNLFPHSNISALQSMSLIWKAFSLSPRHLRLHRFAWASPSRNLTYLITLGHSITMYPKVLSMRELQLPEQTWPPKQMLRVPIRPLEPGRKVWYLSAVAKLSHGLHFQYTMPGQQPIYVFIRTSG